MQEANQLFSICMPTYNRADTLKESLPDLIAKVKNQKIKIFIHDNNSTDDTEKYIAELKREYPYIVYQKSDIHREADKNMKRALEISDTMYRLLLGDHYILFDKSSVDTILDYLSRDQEFDAIVLHYKNRPMFREENFVYSDKNLFLEDLGWYIGMAATTIYHQKAVENMQFEKYYDTSFAQSLTLLDYMANKNFKIQYIAQDLVWNTKNGVKGERSWHIDALKIFAKNWYKGIMSLPDNYSNESKFTCIKNHAKMAKGFFSFKSLILYRYAGGISFWKVLKYSKYLYFSADFKTVLLGLYVSLIPVFSIKYFFKEEWEYIQRVLGGMDKYQ